MDIGTANRDDEQASLQAFEKKSKLMRSPVPSRGRLGSLPDLQHKGISQHKHDQEISQQWKRKRAQNSPDSSNHETINNAVNLMQSLSNIASETKKLANVVKDMYHPKNEIKDGVIKLMREIETIHQPEIQLWLQNLEQGGTGSETMQQKENAKLRKQLASAVDEHKKEVTSLEQTLQKEIVKLRKQIVSAEEQHKKELAAVSTDLTKEKCEECVKLQRRKARQQAFTKVDTYENYQSLEEEIWDDGIFQQALQAHGAIWEAPREYVLILPCNKKIQGINKETTKAINKYGGFSCLKNQNKVKGEAAMMVHSLGYPDNNGSLVYETRDIFYPIFDDDGGIDQAQDENIFKSLCEIKKQMVDRGKTHLAYPEIQGVTGTIIDRMMEFLYFDTNIQLQRYKQGDQTRSSGGTKKVVPGQSNTQPQTNIKKLSRKPIEEAILVKANEKTYSDMLKKLKNDINTDEIGIEIHDVKKTQKGDLLIKVKRDMEKIETLKKEIRDKLPGAITTLLTKKIILHLKDLDEVTTTEDIAQAIIKAIPLKKEHFEVRALRPTKMGRQNATVIMTEADAHNLLSLGKLKVGWTNCRVAERIKGTRCSKCWETGHEKKDCKGPDRQDLCFKCTKNDHKIANCNNMPFCLACNNEGHQTGSVKCPVTKSSKTHNALPAN